MPWKIKIRGKFYDCIALEAANLDPSSRVIKRAAHPVNSSPYWGLLGAEINAGAGRAGAGKIKALSAIPRLTEPWDHTVPTGHKKAASAAHLEAALEQTPQGSRDPACSSASTLPQWRQGKASPQPQKQIGFASACCTTQKCQLYQLSR